jgi:hypothetical protein
MPLPYRRNNPHDIVLKMLSKTAKLLLQDLDSHEAKIVTRMYIFFDKVLWAIRIHNMVSNNRNI